MDVIKFTSPGGVKHGRFHFLPGPAYGFQDPDAAPYFKACGWAEDSTEEPAVVITVEEIDIDPCTIWGDGSDKGRFVMPDRAAAARGTTLEEAQAYVWDGQEVLKHG